MDESLVCGLAVIFWLSLLYLAYVEIGYLLILALLARFRRKAAPPGEVTPALTVLVAAHNEAGVIEARLENLFAQDYPPERVQVIVASDGSTDGTDEIVRQVAERHPGRLRLVRSERRGGKIAALRQAEPEITGEVVVFTDADACFRPGALRKLARHFGDPQVGAVSGREVRPRAGEHGRGEGLYNRLETLVKLYEGRVGDQALVHGGIFALRRALLPDVPDHLTHDAIVPLRLRLHGFRTLYEPEAISEEAYDLDTRADWRRRIRTVMQAYQSYLFVREALDPRRTGWYAVQVISHRFLRWFVFPVLVLALASNLALWNAGPIYRALAVAQVACYGLALAGGLLDRLGYRPALFYFPFYFVYLHLAALVAILLSWQGKTVATWQPASRRV